MAASDKTAKGEADLMVRGVVALETIAALLGRFVGYVETNGVPGSLFERAQRGIGTAKTIKGVVKIYRAVRFGVGPGERAALLDVCAGVAAGLANPARPEVEKWARWVVEDLREVDAAREDAAVKALREAAEAAKPEGEP